MAPNNEPLRAKKRKSSDQNRAGPSRKKSKTLAAKAGSEVTTTTVLSTSANKNKNTTAESLKGKGKGKEKETEGQELLPVQPTRVEQGQEGLDGSVRGPGEIGIIHTMTWSIGKLIPHRFLRDLQ
jgi:hypothetical protein